MPSLVAVSAVGSGSSRPPTSSRLGRRGHLRRTPSDGEGGRARAGDAVLGVVGGGDRCRRTICRRDRGRFPMARTATPRGGAAASDSAAIVAAKAAVMTAAGGTNNGLDATDAQRASLEAVICELEALNPTPDPASSPLVDGNWRVVYSTAPPPSNGSLGPFKGVAYQDISLADGSYVNVLAVPPNDWLGARLVAGWDAVKDETGRAGRLWVVDFRSVTVRLFGCDLFTKTFEDTTRVWDMTYVDEDTRVVRAARTMRGLRKEGARGRKANAGVEDDCVFVMVRA